MGAPELLPLPLTAAQEPPSLDWHGAPTFTNPAVQLPTFRQQVRAGLLPVRRTPSALLSPNVTCGAEERVGV
jgi:hypothetical protein